jgi:hypothetical protein
MGIFRTLGKPFETLSAKILRLSAEFSSPPTFENNLEPWFREKPKKNDKYRYRYVILCEHFISMLNDKERKFREKDFLFSLQIPFCIYSRSSSEFVPKIFLLEGLRGSSHIAIFGKSGSVKRKEIFLRTLILWIIFDNIFEI